MHVRSKTKNNSGRALKIVALGIKYSILYFKSGRDNITHTIFKETQSFFKEFLNGFDNYENNIDFICCKKIYSIVVYFILYYKI